MALNVINLNELISEEKDFIKTFFDFLKNITTNNKELDNEIVYMVDKHFWELI